MNTPYVKTFDQDGVVQNTGNYLNDGTNRRSRRKRARGERFFNNRNTTPITVYQNMKYLRQYQYIALHKKGKPTGEIKRIEHYIPCV